ncbi:LuxR C-terminal-related transcriptional regulator [Aeromonas caviae]|uniref:helix-turn-helix transcriptional regulator n=1 Tax=Aeromonas caviae TaxID=648 RepID=UPI002B251171|nr:LuxR C-terminal-related transcriptional regulator [Aeromonas caviae]MEA9429375.1 LuxR C-terminal-related transcriptional regulator [Aeromonas caviae]
MSRKDASPQSSASARRIPGRILSGNGVHRFRNHCSTSPEYAIFWNKLDCDAPWLPSASREVMNLAADFGVRNGVSFPLHTPQGEHGILSFISKEKSNSDLMFENVPLLSFCASYIFNSALTLIKARPDLMKYLAELSDREKECLFWASEGKTSWEIATILGISERTVNFHLNQVTNKTDSRNRNQAIAKSISSGIIVPSLDDVTITNLRLS